MKIAVVNADASLVGGVETYLDWLIPALCDAGHSVAFAFERPVVTPPGGVAAQASFERIDVGRLGVDATLGTLRRFAPDIVFLQGNTRVALDEALLREFPSVLFAHGHYGSCATGTRAHARPEPRLCHREFGRACLSVNYLRGCGAIRPDRLLRDYRAQRERQSLLSEFDAVVVASHAMETELRAVAATVPEPNRIGRSRGRSTKEKKWSVNPCPPSTAIADEKPPEPRAFVDRVVFLGRLTELKGPAHAVRAVATARRALNRKLELVVAGVGPEKERMERLARELHVPVKMVGWLNREQREATLRDADALIVPSVWSEPFAMVGIEAGCVGVPAVAYPAFGISEWLRAGINGELARGERFDPSALSDALVRALSDAERYQRLRVGAWNVAREYSPERHFATLLDVFQKVMLAD